MFAGKGIVKSFEGRNKAAKKRLMSSHLLTNLELQKTSTKTN